CARNPWVLVSETDLVGIWAHEVGHDLGLFFKPSQFCPDNPLQCMVPHPTLGVKSPPYVGLWDVMTYGAYGCGLGTEFTVTEGWKCPSGNALHSTPTFMSSITRQFLGLIKYDPKTQAEAIGTFWINALETTQLGEKVLKVDLNDDQCR